MPKKKTMDPGFREWIRGNCLYRCDACAVDLGGGEVTFADSLEFWRHVQQRHGLDNTEFARRYPGYTVRKSTTICRCDIKLEIV